MMMPRLLLPLVLLAGLAACSSASSAVLDKSMGLQPWLVETRRTLHKIPELGFEEVKTAAYIQGVLSDLNISFTSGIATTGIIGTIGSGKPIIMLRSDIDALPVEEPEGFEDRSQHPGRMHACGHDTHMAMLLGAAKLLQEENQKLPGGLPGTVKLVFQPFEEGGAGADLMLKTGALDGIEAAFGMHVMPHIRTGILATRPGTIMAGALSFHITVRGRGGHAALPHLNVDPIVAAAALISSLQTLVSRETSPLGSGVLSVTMIRAGDTYNVIPDEAVVAGTIRALDHAHLRLLQRRVEEMSPKVVAGFGCNITVDWRLEEQPLYPPVVNDPRMVDFSVGVATKLFGGDDVSGSTEPLMAGEDFSFFCMAAPCTFAFLGIRNETAGSVHNLHNPRFTMDETVLYRGTAMHTAWALSYLDAFGKGAAAAHKEEL